MNWTHLFLQIAVVFLTLFVAHQLHIILHEAGHLLFGKLSGYHFVSFRVYNQMLVKEHGKLVRKKYNVVGTGGQALMSPPELKNGTFPLALYNMGGALMNVLVGALCLWLFFLVPSFWKAAFLTAAVLGVGMGLINIIPLRVGGIPNDGYNLLTLRRKQNAAARHAFWVMLRANAMVASGSRAREFPAQWFDWIDMAHLDDPLVASAAVLRYNYLLDSGELAEARSLLQTLFDTATELPSVIRNELRCELLFHELIHECREEEIDRLYTGALKDYIKITFTYASRQRLLYAYARLFTKDAEQAEAHLELFREACKKSASLGEIPGEQELVALVDEIAEKRETVIS